MTPREMSQAGYKEHTKSRFQPDQEYIDDAVAKFKAGGGKVKHLKPITGYYDLINNNLYALEGKKVGGIDDEIYHTS